MAEKIILPKQGLQMVEGTIVEWCVKEGEAVVKGEPLFVMETDKVTFTVEAETGGTLLKILAPIGAVVPVAQAVAIVGKSGEDISALLAAADSVRPVPAEQSAEMSLARTTGSRFPVSGERIFISPRARMRAEELGVDYAALKGSAPDGVIVERDILNAKASAPKASPLAAKTAELSGVDLFRVKGTGIRGKIMRDDVIKARKASGSVQNIIPLKGMRKIIAEKMKQSQNENAQACHRVSVRMDEAIRLRLSLNKEISINDLIAFAVVRSLADFPAMNVELTSGGIWQKDFVNLGVAVAVDNGLLVPVVKDADLLSLRELSAAVKSLVEKTRAGNLKPEEYSDGTFTLSNLGMFGLEEFVAIINPPEAGILAVGKIEDTPVADNGQVVIRPVMKLTLSYDHRVIDGAPAAQFLSRVKEYLENPYKFL
jgi:pyruvate dehydrogenase E2 component (dihydrolipoamide acetyltransferase)